VNNYVNHLNETDTEYTVKSEKNPILSDEKKTDEQKKIVF